MFNSVLGFAAAVKTAPSDNYSFFSEDPASFNRNNSYIIASNIVSQGIPINDKSRGIIGTVPISSRPGKEINYDPQNVVWFDCKELIGGQKRNMTFNLLNQSLQATPTSGEYWSFTLAFK